jgi:hypothetical protein
VLAHRCTWDEATLVALHNLGPEPLTVPIELAGEDEGTVLADLLCDGEAVLDAKGRVEMALDGYGFRWLRVVREGDRRLR